MTTIYNEKEKPCGIKCDCGVETKFIPYIYAHWDHELIFTCQACGKKATILCGLIIGDAQ